MKIDWVNVLIGLLLGFLLTRITDWSRRVKLKYLNFENIDSNFGQLFKLRFILKGFSAPGKCSCEILTPVGNTFAKWDETPNPLENDDLNKFIPEKVPETFFQTLYVNKEYLIPIIIKENSNLYVFSGWWFGKKDGYYNLPKINPTDKITLIIRGDNFIWKKDFNLNEILNI